MTLIGELSLWVALLMAAWGATVSFAGGRLQRADLIASGERAVYATLALVVLAAIGLWSALLTHEFSLVFVAANTSRNMPALYIFAAFWGGQAGSLLLFCLVLVASAALAVVSSRAAHRQIMPWLTGTLAVVILFFLAALCLGANPYARLDWVPLDGRGMHPRLQHPLMAIHAPVLYVGYAATAIPFALGIAALLARTLDAEWLAAVRRWTLIAWAFLTAGILLGMRWAYTEPGVVGHWAWEPVANASILPWIATTAALHSIVVQERRGTLRTWNIALVASSFLLSVVAAVLTRSRVMGGVQSFAQFPLGDWFAGFAAALFAVTAWLIVRRAPRLSASAALETMVSREEGRPGSRLVPGHARRRYGGYVAHAGAALMFGALAGLAFRQDHDVSLAAGEAFEAADPFGRDWVFVSQGISRFEMLNREVTALALDVTRDGRRLRPIVSEVRQYVDGRGTHAFDPTTKAGLLEALSLDTYVVLAGVSEGDASERAKLRISFNPFVRWVWIGGALVVLGGIILMWPQADRR